MRLGINVLPKEWWNDEAQIWVRLTSKAELERNCKHPGMSKYYVVVSLKYLQLPPSETSASFFLLTQDSFNISTFSGVTRPQVHLSSVVSTAHCVSLTTSLLPIVEDTLSTCRLVREKALPSQLNFFTPASYVKTKEKKPTKIREENKLGVLTLLE